MSSKGKLRNVSPGIRVVNVRDKKAGKDAPPTQHQLMPGAELPDHLDLVDEEHPSIVAMLESRELAYGDPGEEKPEDKQAREEARFRNDPFQRENREVATRAGNTPGYADPLPPGTDTQGGKESEAARQNAGVVRKSQQQK